MGVCYALIISKLMQSIISGVINPISTRLVFDAHCFKTVLVILISDNVMSQVTMATSWLLMLMVMMYVMILMSVDTGK